ncbi:MAG TPA: GntR family transcriptional regulator [Xanthobacteraceae bacterium]|nr:GntR family transcriptional regulator [Xanthobacteraceae bacterium]
MKAASLVQEERARAIPVIRRSAAPLRQEVLEALRSSIVDGRLAPGARLIERELIAMTGVSRTVIREALRQLEAEGLVHVVPNRGAIVRELTADEARDLYAIRALLEGLAARMFVEKASTEEVAALGRELKATAAAYKRRDPEETILAKNRFFAVLFAGAKSETLSTMLATLMARIWRWRALGLSHPRRSPGRGEESLKGLQALYKAIVARDVAAAEELARAEVTHAAEEIARILQR